MRLYRYVGPPEIRSAVAGSPAGRPLTDGRFLPDGSEPHTFVVSPDGVLLTADRGSEHVACAGGGPVLAAGEIQFAAGAVVMASNQSTGYCPEPSCWDAVAAALDRAGVPHPGAFTHPLEFRLCPACDERNVVRDGDFTCALCAAALPLDWNFSPRVYRYAGPSDVGAVLAGSAPGRVVLGAGDVSGEGEPFAFTVGVDGVLRIATWGSKHLACAGSTSVLSAGKIQFAGGEVVAVSNHSTGFRPEPSSWDAVAAALDRAGIGHPDGFTHPIEFRR